ncbi:MAG: hypothetical protein HY834_14785 [Devosia nanyangense]|uniref:Uncharacterized protein n=1 Tax=Devosia nanyangense TaxID=1228055 RepID=A0A933L300_9HYPH|nr:hypothetical protein [Devosia nanyangense]
MDHHDYVSLHNPGLPGLQLPYCLVKLDSPRHIWLPLNRQYKPLGVTSREWVDYDEFVSRAVAFASDPRKWHDVFLPHDPGASILYLHRDGQPASEYFARLTRLLWYRQRSIGEFDIFQFQRARVLRATPDLMAVVTEVFGPSKSYQNRAYWATELAHDTEKRAAFLKVAKSG